MWKALCLFLCVDAVCGTEPATKFLFNEVGLDANGLGHFIELKRNEGTDPVALDHHFIAVLNTRREKGCHFELRGLIKLSGTSMAAEQLIGWIGDPTLHDSNHLASFMDVKKPPRMVDENLLKVKVNGYLVLMMIYAETEYWHTEELRPLIGEMQNWIMNNFYDVLIVKGPQASVKSTKLNQLLSKKVPSGSIKYLEDTSRVPDVSQSNCGERKPFQTKWDLTSPTVGRENACPGGTLDVEMELEDMSDSLPVESMDGDCQHMSEASFVNEQKLDLRLTEAKERGSGTCGYISGEMAEIRAQVSVSKKRRLLVSGETQMDELPWCMESEFKDEWIDHIEQYQSDLLPLAGNVFITN